jgi:hypothetical protein
MTGRLLDYVRRRGAYDAFAAIVVSAGIWTLMTWAQTLAEVARVRLG